MKAIDLIESWENDDFDWKNYSEKLKRENSQLHFEIKQLKKRETELREAMQWFVNRCDNGEVRSKKTYKKFKELLNK